MTTTQSDTSGTTTHCAVVMRGPFVPDELLTPETWKGYEEALTHYYEGLQNSAVGNNAPPQES